ncbi:MAG TPA: fused MFS/spermidine synthase [Pseudomonadales bacterium]
MMRIAAGLFTFVLLLPAGDAQGRIVHRERSLYSTILIDQQGSLVCLQFSIRTDQRNQSCMDQRRPNEMVFSYTRMMMTGLLLRPSPERILMIGLGGGTLPTALAELYPDTEIDVVEIDPAVVRVAGEFFGYVPSANTTVFTQDGRVFIKRAALRGDTYDLIMLDAFNGDYIPEHLMTREFLQETRSLLTPGGAVVANTFSISQLYHHESTTYTAVFGRFYNLKTGESANRIILAANGPLPDPTIMEQRAADLAPRVRKYGISLSDHVKGLETRPDWDTSARVLTDQYAPANLLRDR